MRYAAYALILFGAYLFFHDDTLLMGLGITWIILGGLILRNEPDGDAMSDPESRAMPDEPRVEAATAEIWAGTAGQVDREQCGRIADAVLAVLGEQRTGRRRRCRGKGKVQRSCFRRGGKDYEDVPCPVCGGVSVPDRAGGELQPTILILNHDTGRRDPWVPRGVAEAAVARAEGRARELAEALAWYAESVNYAPQNPPGTGSPIWRDAGKRAREALATPGPVAEDKR